MTLPSTVTDKRQRASAASPDEAPGLPGLRDWRGVYVVVFALFVVVVAALAIFSIVYS